ncbi:15763_t:CDS:2 [Racocetra fulgida]|uniref:15763_t:CDS:1 n=1 Tax=Racocetra fulgida TaxID=60492 RepID=A0A9N9FNF6_9GLOM|nr:15763_t:CDS:2 [Racocetra fulgida]
MADPNIETQLTQLSHRQTTESKVDKDTKFERDYVPPDIKIQQIRQAIPPHCFEQDTWKSAGYLVKDLAMIAALVYAATFIDTYLPQMLRFIAWLVYWFFCGAFATGVWVIAHECGHQAFSPHKSINNTVGLILHSALLVPYHSWRITHSKHHKHTDAYIFITYVDSSTIIWMAALFDL